MDDKDIVYNSWLEEELLFCSLPLNRLWDPTNPYSMDTADVSRV